MTYYSAKDAPAPHGPDYPKATLVGSGSEFGVIVSIMCICGSDWCSFTANAYPGEIVFLPDNRPVAVVAPQ